MAFGLLALPGLVGTTLTASASTVTGAAPQVMKPVIGKPITSPAQPQAGKRFTVAFRVTRSDTGAPLLRGRMICDPSVSGKVLRHAESFRAGTARLSFLIPANAAGQLLKVKVTIKAGRQSATKVAPFRIQGAQAPSISIGDVSAAEGNGGVTTLSFPVTLSASSTQTVTVAYATSDGTAQAPSDYTAASGTLVFKPGETSKTIAVGVVGDLAIEQSETLTVTLSSPANATIADGTATGTITNDDTAAPVTAGSYKGQTQNGNYVFFTVTSGRAVTDLRINALPCMCQPPARLDGAPDFGDATISIGVDTRFSAEDTWSGSDKVGDMEWTYVYVKITGHFDTATSATGTIVITMELNYEGTHYRCSSGEVTWSATLQS
jgi:hypothetical protein